MWCDFEGDEALTSVRTLRNRAGEQFDVRILSTCHYAKEVMPIDEISVIGVIDYSDNRYFLRIINKSFI